MPRRMSDQMNGVMTPGGMRVRGTRAAEVEGSLQREQPVTRTLADLNFKVSVEFRRRFDRLAYEMDLKNIQILERALEVLERQWEEEVSSACVRLAVSIKIGLNPEGRRGPQDVAQRVREVLEQVYHPTDPADLQVELEE